jgi:hypothetical protein
LQQRTFGDFGEREKKRGSEISRLTGKAWCARKEGRANDFLFNVV